MTTPNPFVSQIEEMLADCNVPNIVHRYFADPIDVTAVGQDFHTGGHDKKIEALHEEI